MAAVRGYGSEEYGEVTRWSGLTSVVQLARRLEGAIGKTCHVSRGGAVGGKEGTKSWLKAAHFGT